MHYWGDGGEAIRRIKAGAVVTPYILQVTKDCDDDDDDGDDDGGGGDHADDSHNHDDESHNHNDDNDRGDDHHNALSLHIHPLGLIHKLDNYHDKTLATSRKFKNCHINRCWVVFKIIKVNL